MRLPPQSLLIFTLIIFSACNADAEPPAEAAAPPKPHAAPKTRAAPLPAAKKISAASLSDEYAWLGSLESGLDVLPLSRRFAPPAGYRRVEVAEGSFGQFLRDLPLRVDRTSVLSYRGARLSSPSAAVVAMDVGERNLQQCADTIIRLHAEYLWSAGQKSALAYHFTSGDETRWSDWKNGERYVVSGSTVERVRRGPVAATHAQFRRWLDTVFMYAGTRSLRFDSRRVAGPIRPGDFFVDPGSPGHALIVLDVAKNAAGRRVALLGQGFMPAQELHVLRGRPGTALDRVWFLLPDAAANPAATLKTPSWQPFSPEQARRFGP
jgi:hypothetical protein